LLLVRSHGSQVAPAGQLSLFPLHMIVHGVAPPHSTVHVVEPPHSATQPPAGQRIVHALLPSQVTWEPRSRDTSQRLPPAHVTWLLVPAASEHWLVPAHVDVQFEAQVPAHVERPSQVFVQPIPQLRSHWFFESQWYVTSLGGAPITGAPASRIAPPSPAVAATANPKEHLPPALQTQVVPSQAQSPVQVGGAPPVSWPPQLAPPKSARSPRLSAKSHRRFAWFMFSPPFGPASELGTSDAGVRYARSAFTARRSSASGRASRTPRRAAL
jgi:hypothetical protein